jgi:hypothetical protein
MSMQTDLEVFERAVEARGRLLRVEGDRAGTQPRQLLLTFDVGRIRIQPTDEALSVNPIEDPSALASEWVPLVEEEPWWRVLGQPLTAAWPGGTEAATGARSAGPLLALKLRFREETEHPRIVRLESAGSAVRVSLEG